MTIFRPISNLRNKPKIWKIRPNKIVFRLISNFGNKTKIWKIRPNNIVLPVFKVLYTNIWDYFWGWKISPKSEGVNPWFLTIFPPIWNFQKKSRIWKFRPNSILLPLFERLYTNIWDHFWGRQITPNTNPWFLTIFRLISNFGIKIKIWKIRPNNGFARI